MPANIATSAAIPTDAEILRDIMYRMKNEKAVPADRIKAAVSGGTLTLEGTVDWNHEREAAENCGKTVLGVRRIVNRIKIAPAVSSRESW